MILQTDTVLTTKSSILDKDLTNDERSVVNVVRLCGPSVAYVTSYSIPPERRRRSGRPNSRQNDKKNDTKKQVPPPGSRAMGSGTAFAISSNDGYFVTNYHVIENAYRMQQNQITMDAFMKNVTKSFFPFSSESKNDSDDGKQSRRYEQVYLRLSESSSSSTSNLIPARIVSVKPELDSAILQIQPSPPSSSSSSSSQSTENNINNIQLPQPIPYGQSSKLLVGQTVLAIGNPFGLDRTITSGVVSALNRSVKGVANNQISNCIQTDAAINPGNSGGPLLNSNGECIGMNTMIISTSGSNAGIGFAIGMDEIRDYVESEIELDRMRLDREVELEDGGSSTSSGSSGRVTKKRGYLGIEILIDSKLDIQLRKRIRRKLKSQNNDAPSEEDDKEVDGVFVIQVEKNSPACDANIKPTRIDKATSRVQMGDRIIAINSNIISSYQELCNDLKTRVVGENLSITVEDENGQRRVVYLELGSSDGK